MVESCQGRNRRQKGICAWEPRRASLLSNLSIVNLNSIYFMPLVDFDCPLSQQPVCKESACNEGDVGVMGVTSGSERQPEEGNGTPVGILAWRTVY